jgi:mannose-1-phosphate guanylyltransferase
VARIKAVIIAGGKGERFWPKSRIGIPKQLLAITSGKSMLYETVRRIRSLVQPSDIMIIAREGLRARIARERLGIPAKNIVTEPCGRDTAAAIGLGAVLVGKRDPDSIMVVLPSDHLIAAPKKFSKTLRLAIKTAEETSRLVTMGIRPSRPETGYGYIEIDSPSSLPASRLPVYKVKRFTEKPNRKEAQKFVRSGRYLWNSGIFIWRVSVIREAIRKYMPQLDRGLREIAKALGTSQEKKVMQEVYKRLDKMSIDYGIMEKVTNSLVVKADYPWDDVGNWQALERILTRDGAGNVARGEVFSIDTKDSVLFSDKGLLAAIGVKDLVVISTKDATLVCSKERAQEVKELVHKIGKDAKLKKYV